MLIHLSPPVLTHLVLVALVARYIRDFYTGVTMADMSEPTPGNYPLCTGRFNGAMYYNGRTVSCAPGVIGRYLWIQSAAEADMSLREVKVYAG